MSNMKGFQNSLEAYTEEIISKYQAGQGCESIGKEYGCAELTIKRFLIKSGVELRGRKNPNTVDETLADKIESLYKQGNSAYAIGPMIGFSRGAVERALKKRGYDISDGQRKRDDPLINHVDEIVELYTSGIGTYKIAKLFDTYDHSISTLLKKHGVSIRGTDKYFVDESFFEIIDSEIKAYILGFIYTDGNIDDEHASFTISLADLDILERMKDELKYEGPIHSYRPKKDHHKIKYTLDIDRRKMVEDIKKLGCMPRKSLIIKFPTNDQVPSQYHLPFIRGIFDGNGSVFQDKNNAYGINFSGTQWLVFPIADIIERELDIKPSRVPDGKIHKIMFGGINQVKKFLNWIYGDASIYLPRKYAYHEKLNS